jgi:hypothetical protein
MNVQDVDGWLTNHRKLWDHRPDQAETCLTTLEASDGKKDTTKP